MATVLAEYLIDHGLREEAALSLERALAEDGERSHAAIRANAFLNLSYARTEAGGDRKEMIDYAEKGLALYQEIEDAKSVARALYYCGYAYTGYDWDRARAYINQSVELYESASIEPTDGIALLGAIEILTGNFEEARTLLARRRAIHEKQADESSLIRTDTWLAFIYYYEGRFDEAQSLAERSLQYRRDHGSVEEERLPPLDVLIHIALHKRHLVRARTLLCERLRIMVNNDYFANAIRCFDEVAEWLFLTGRPRQAAFWLGCFDQAYAWTQVPLEPIVLPHYQWLVSEVRETLGEAAYTAAWEKGYAMAVEDALPLALQVMEQVDPEPGSCKTPSDQSK